MIITREQIEAKRRVRKYVEVVIDDATWRLQSLCESEKSDYEYSLQSRKPMKSQEERIKAARVALLVRVVVGEDNQRIFADDDEIVFMEQDGRDIAILHDAASKLCGYTKQDEEDLAKKLI
jgi:hypothetical protein